MQQLALLEELSCQLLQRLLSEMYLTLIVDCLMDSVRKLIFTCKTFEIDPQHFFLLIPRNHIQNYIFLIQVQYEPKEMPLRDSPIQKD